MSLSEFLKDEMNDKVVIGEGHFFAIQQSVVVTWIVMAVIIVLCIILGSKLRVHNISKRQAAAEFIVTKLEDLIVGITGEGGRPYTCYLFTVIIFLGLANIMGVFGFKPPTKSLVVTAPLAIMSIVLVQMANVRAHSVKGWLHSFIEPSPVVSVFNILDLITRPLSLCMRLFGNVLGAFVVMEMINHVTKLVVPAALSLYFDFFDGILQAYVFIYLTGMYIREATENAENTELPHA